LTAPLRPRNARRSGAIRFGALEWAAAFDGAA